MAGGHPIELEGLRDYPFAFAFARTVEGNTDKTLLIIVKQNSVVYHVVNHGIVVAAEFDIVKAAMEYNKI